MKEHRENENLQNCGRTQERERERFASNLKKQDLQKTVESREHLRTWRLERSRETV